ncbi:MAG: hypothetical protein ACLU4P_04550 [Ruminococcus sp.]
MITISRKGVKSDMTLADTVKKRAHCVFEYIYFARLDSTMDGVKVYDARIRGGKSLAKSYPVEADLVTGVPESGLPAAKGFSEESGIPFGFAFYKNSYIGRTFIKPTLRRRESSVHRQLGVLDGSWVVKENALCLWMILLSGESTIANTDPHAERNEALQQKTRAISPRHFYIHAISEPMCQAMTS